MCAISLGKGDLELRLANKHAKSLPGDGETEYSHLQFQIYMEHTVDIRCTRVEQETLEDSMKPILDFWMESKYVLKYSSLQYSGPLSHSKENV